jgi:Fe-S-cluster containining protein
VAEDQTRPDDGRRPPFAFPGADKVNHLLRQAEIIVEKQLEQARTPESLIQAAAQTQNFAERNFAQTLTQIAQATQNNPPGQIKCKAGCDHCCYRIPEVTLAELALIWDAIKTKSEQDKLDLRARIETYAQKTTKACPLLKDRLCTVYETRPLSCRALNSTDVQACEQIKQGLREPKTRPVWAEPFQVAAAVRTGERVGLFFESVDPLTVDLGLALKILFDNPDAITAILDGAPTFKAAASATETEPFYADNLAGAHGPAFISQQELDQPSGNLPNQEAEHLRQAGDSYLQTGDWPAYLANLQQPTPGQMISRINVPRVCMSEQEIDASREAYVQAIQDFKTKDFPPDQSFNALSFHQVMNLPYQGRDDLEILTQRGQLITDHISKRALLHLTKPREGKRKPGKLRVGYISGDLNSSSNGRWAWPFVRHHSDEIEVFCYHVGRKTDRTTELFRMFSEHFFWLNRSVPQNAEFIRSHDLDALIFTDIGLFGRMTQYSALRLAPIQCMGWGSLETSGLSTIDYFLTSGYMEPPDGDRYATEKLVRLPRTGILFYKDNWQIPDRDRAHFGLPTTGPLILMVQAVMKLLPFDDQLLARVSEKANAEIVFFESDPPGDSNLIKARLKQAGVRAKWLPPLPFNEFLALLRIADVSIDPYMFSGGYTTVQALTLGTPVVTYPGPFKRSRQSQALLTQAGAPGLIAQSEEDYIDLATNPDRRREAAKDLNPAALYGDLGVIQALDEFLFKVTNH